MKLFELRLADHHRRNSTHLKNLRKFLDDQERFSRLPKDDQALIREQLRHMDALDKVLEARMRRLNIPV